MPAAPAVRLRPLAAADVSAAEQLWANRFGGAPDTRRKWMEAALAPAHSAAGMVAVTPDDTVVGVSFLEVGSRDYARQYLGVGRLHVDVALAARNGLFHLTCVRADWEGRGIGTAFYEHRLERLSDRGIRRAFGVAWHRPTPPGSRTLFEKHGFTRLATVERYYARTGNRPHCPACGGPCTCTASLYGRSVSS
jgi:GNAT superfamily N-acetyltransferase